MSHFYGNMKGSRGETTRCGDMYRGIRAHVRGWHLGVQSNMRHINGSDRAMVYITAGSNGGASDLFLGEFVRTDKGFACDSGPLRVLIDAAEQVAENYVDLSATNRDDLTPPSVKELRRIINMLEGK